jgi:peroxiredoxin Q/BCP
VEVKGYRDQLERFRRLGAQVVGISTDTVAAQRSFASVVGATFPLLSDETGKVARAYGVLDEHARVAVRTTFVIDRVGRVSFVVQGLKAIDPSSTLSACGG